MNLLILSRYSRLGASSRMRSYQYQPLLASAGISVSVSPLFSDAYVTGLQGDQKRVIEVLSAYARRVATLITHRRFDLIWIEKEALPWLPAWLERALRPGAVPYVLDYDDAVFHYYDQHRHAIVRSVLGGKHQALMQGAAMVMAGNSYLAEVAQRANARRVEIVPTVIDLDRYPVPAIKSTTDLELPCVGWIGQRATAECLRPHAQLFQQLVSNGLARFVAVGIDAQALGLPMDSVAWTEADEVAAISSFDIGIMPLADEPFERGKCGYKLIQYMACGLPVVASPVGVNNQIVEHGVNGFLAETPEQWWQALRTLLADAGLRQRMGQAGRKMVEQQYCLQVTGPRVVSLLKEVAGAKGAN